MFLIYISGFYLTLIAIIIYGDTCFCLFFFFFFFVFFCPEKSEIVLENLWLKKRDRGESFTLSGDSVTAIKLCLSHRHYFIVGFLKLLVFFCSSVPVVLFDTPGISRCRSQHVSVESSSLLHHSIYLWFICFTWWSIDELENLHADRTIVCFEPW